MRLVSCKSNGFKEQKMSDPDHERRFTQWLDRHAGLLLKVASSFASEKNDREDLLQEISFQVWKSIPGYDNQVKESTWIYRVAFYTAISWLRAESKHQSRNSPSDHLHVISVDTNEDPRVQWLYEKIAELDPVDRSLTLLLLDGFSYREMSETIGISESNVGVRINRIKKQLASKLSKEQCDVIS